MLSKVLVPMLTAGVVLGLDRLAREHRLPMASLFAGFAGARVAAVFLLSLFSFLIFVVQMAVSTGMFGPDVLDAVLLAHMHAHPALMTRTFSCVLILPGLVPSTLLTLTHPDRESGHSAGG